MNQRSYCAVWCLLATDAGFGRNHERRQIRFFLVNIILFAMKTSDAAGDLMVGSGVVAVGTFQVPGEATIGGNVQGCGAGCAAIGRGHWKINRANDSRCRQDESIDDGDPVIGDRLHQRDHG